MSIAARKQLASQLHFTDEDQRADIIDPGQTNTYLVELLQWLVWKCPSGILITALNSDHPTYDGGPHGNGHNAGKAADIWTASSDDTKVLEIIEALAKCPWAWTVGLGGSSKQYESYVTWPSGPFVFFEDNNTDHIHVQCANQYGIGLRA